MSETKTLRYYERKRASDILGRYQQELSDRLYANPYATNAEQVKVVVQRLDQLRAEIIGTMRNYRPPPKRDPRGGFSEDEIESVADILQEENPFDG